MDGIARPVTNWFPDEYGFEAFIQFPSLENGTTGWGTLLAVTDPVAKLSVLLVAGDAAAITVDISRRLATPCRPSSDQS